VARHVSLCHAHFGVFRAVALRRTGLIRPYVASDYTLLAEVARLGRIHEVDRPLFHRRVHGGSTLQAKGATAASAAAWFGPTGGPAAAGTGRTATRWRMVRETVAVLAGGDLPLTTRLSCAVTFPVVWYLRRARVLLGRWGRWLVRYPRFTFRARSST
jgi:hypothetical protein